MKMSYWWIAATGFAILGIILLLGYRSVRTIFDYESYYAGQNLVLTGGYVQGRLEYNRVHIDFPGESEVRVIISVEGQEFSVDSRLPEMLQQMADDSQQRLWRQGNDRATWRLRSAPGQNPSYLVAVHMDGDAISGLSVRVRNPPEPYGPPPKPFPIELTLQDGTEISMPISDEAITDLLGPPDSRSRYVRWP